MFFTRAHVSALEAQIADLKERLDKSERERAVLLDRLLAKNNIEPTRQVTLDPPDTKRPVIEILSPFGVNPPEIEDGVRASWVAEETDYLMMVKGLDAERAKIQAEQNYLSQYQTAIK